MFDDLNQSSESINSDEAFDLLQDLGRNTPDEIRRQRAHFRVAVKAAVVLQPGNASELMNFKVKGPRVMSRKVGSARCFRSRLVWATSIASALIATYWICP